jgi:hypothetical protein
LYRGDNSGSRSSSKISTRSRAGVRSAKRPHMPQFYRAASDDRDAPGRRDRRWAASGRKRSNRVTATAGSFPTLASAHTARRSDRHSVKRNSAGLVVWKCGEKTARLLLAIVIAVGRILSGGHPTLPPEKSRPEAGLREQSSSEGGLLRVVRFCSVRSSQLALAEAKSWS